MSEAAAPASSAERRPASRGFWAALAVVAAIYVALGLWFAQTKSVWSPDTGARLIQVQSILRHPPDWSIIYPAEPVDPKHQNSPLAFYEYRHGGKSYIFYSFLFALASTPFFAALGYFGLAVLPIAGGIGAFLITHALARRLRFRHPLAPALIVALAGPVPLYSVVFWDHAILAALGMTAVYLALRGIESDCRWGWLGAGLLIGGGVWLHEIMAPYLVALLLTAWWLRRHHSAGRNGGLLLIGAMALIIPLLLFNLKVYGSASGPHLANNKLGTAGGLLSHLGKPDEWGLGILYTLIGWGDANPAYTHQLKAWTTAALEAPDRNRAMYHQIFWSVVMGIPLLVWIPVALTGLWKRAPWIVPVVLVPFAGISAYWILGHMDLVHGLFYASPILTLALIAPLSRPAAGESDSEPTRRLLQALAISTAAYAFITLLKPTLGGTEWGSRHLLSIVPALALLAWAAVEALAATRTESLGAVRWAPQAMPVLVTAVVLLAGSAAVTVQGARVAHSMHRNSGALARAIEQTPDQVVVTTVWWAATMAAPAYPAKQIVSAEDAAHPAPPLFARMRARGVRAFTLLGFSPDDLVGFAIPQGYVPIRDSQRRAPFNLWTRRYFLAGPDAEPEPDLPPPPPDAPP